MSTRILKSAQPISLATYREIQAHLQQLLGVQVSLYPNTSPSFSYGDSQIEGLTLITANGDSPRLREILQYYGFSL